MELFADFDTRKDTNGLTALVHRWSCDSHNFVTAWGEFSPTLEDVGIFLRLEVWRDHNASPIKLSTTEKGIEDGLKSAISKSQMKCLLKPSSSEDPNSRRGNFYGWICYFWRDVEPLG